MTNCQRDKAVEMMMLNYKSNLRNKKDSYPMNLIPMRNEKFQQGKELV
jgi:hypothetical protein